MKKLFTLLMLSAGLLSAHAQTQATNGDFETWTYDGVNLPNNWNSFQTFEKTNPLLSSGYKESDRQVRQSNEVRPGSKGDYSCVIWCRTILGIPAQGNLTTGRIHAGSATADNKSNYNYSVIDGKTTNNGVDNPFAMKFTGRPDSVVFWTKFVPSKVLSDYPNAKFSAIIHDSYNYIAYGLDSNDTGENKSHVVAKAVTSIEKKGGVWQRISLPFDYDSYTNNDPQYIQINASTNAYPGKGTAGDSLYIDDIEMVYKSVITEPLYVTVNGWTNAPQMADVVLTQYKDNFNFSLKNFILSSPDVDMPVGNINVDGLVPDAEGHFSFDGNIMITAGDDPNYSEEDWLGPYLCMDMETGEPAPMHIVLNGSMVGEKVYVDIDIDLMEMMGQIITVHLGDDYVPATMAVNPVAKYGTFCAPFDVTFPEGLGVEASIATLNGKMIELASVGETIPANTPVILYTEDGLEEVAFYGKPVAGTPTVGCLTGVLEPTPITEGYVLQNQNGKVGFYQVTSSKVVSANRAYLTAPAGVKAFYFAEDADGIEKIDAVQNGKLVYDLQGHRVENTQKGVFIMKGKKVVR